MLLLKYGRLGVTNGQLDGRSIRRGVLRRAAGVTVVHTGNFIVPISKYCHVWC